MIKNGRIVKSLAGFYDVESEGEVYQTRARGNFRKKGMKPVVGDFVEFSTEENSEGYILKIGERKNSLIRPSIANIDQAVIIMSTVSPNFSLNLLDRFLVFLEHKNIHPMIYISKLDLLTEMQEGLDKNKKTFNQLTDYEQIKSDYEQIGYDVFFDAEHLVSNLAGKVTVFMGQTGAGKTTLLNILGLRDSNFDGSYIFDSEDITRFSKKRLARIRSKSIGFVFQSFNLIDRLNVLENVALPLTYQGVGKIKSLKKASASLKKLLLNEREYYMPWQLSGGQKQRVFIARALAQDARLYIMDEPLAGVDETTELIIMDKFIELQKEHRTVIAVHHDLSTLDTYFDYLVVLNRTVKASDYMAVLDKEAALALAYHVKE